MDDLLMMIVDGLVQERRNSIANVLELCLSCTNPSIFKCISLKRFIFYNGFVFYNGFCSFVFYYVSAVLYFTMVWHQAGDKPFIEPMITLFTDTFYYVSPDLNQLTHWPMGNLNEILDTVEPLYKGHPRWWPFGHPRWWPFKRGGLS